VRPYLFLVAAGVVLVLRLVLVRLRVGGTLDATPLLFARAPLNAVRFALRRAVGWRRGAPVHPNEDKAELFAFASDPAERARLEARERELREAYDLTALRERSSCEVYRENLYVLDLLDRHVGQALRERRAPAVRAVDVGSKDFRYAFALERFLRHASESERKVSLVGVEIDGHVVYSDLHSRADHGEAYARETGNPDVTYWVGDFLRRSDGDLDVVFFFFPFVLRYALVRWGLPGEHFAPEKLFAHARALLRPGGLLVVVNHTHEERDRQLAILAATGFEVIASAAAESALVDYAANVAERSITVART